MKSCVNWRKSFKYLPQIDEFNIEFRDKKEKLLYFLDQYAISQRVNIYAPVAITDNEFDLLMSIWEMAKYNIALCWVAADLEVSEERINRLKEADFPFYFYAFISDWDKMYKFIEAGVSDIFITNDLGFNLPIVHTLANSKNVKIRCFANISQYNWDHNQGLTGFYIRPEDIDLYSEYIDVLEFYNIENQQNVLYEVYFKDKKWVGDLREIVQAITQPIPNYYILDKSFATTRLTCDRKCLKGNSCNICPQLLDLAKTIESSPDYEIYIKTHIEEKENTNG